MAATDTPSARRLETQHRVSLLMAAGAMTVLSWFMLRLMQLFNPTYGAAMLILMVVTVLAVLRPHIGLGAAIVLALVGDRIAMPWWPAIRNMSSAGSILYTAPPLVIKPVEIVLAAVVATIVINRLATPGAPPLRWGPLWKPMAVFTAALAVGLLWGLSNGGDTRVAFFEITPLLPIPLVYFAATNLFTTLGHYRRLFIGIVIALNIEVVNTLVRLDTIRQFINDDQSPLEHTALLHQNLVPLYLIAVLLFGTRWIGLKTLLLIALVPTMWVYVDAERRSAVVALIIGVAALCLVLYVQNRSRFYTSVPIMSVVGLLYLGAFWNSASQLGFPAQAVKSVIAPDTASSRDALSNLYRVIENYNLNATIRANPLLGQGFGRPFLQPVTLPRIYFEFADFIPHNTILWLWIKGGIACFASFLYMTGLGLAHGVRAAVKLRDPDDVALVATLTAYIPMAVVVFFVEISGEPATTMLLGLALALAGTAERLTAAAAPVEPEAVPPPAPPTPPGSTPAALEATSGGDLDLLGRPDLEAVR